MRQRITLQKNLSRELISTQFQDLEILSDTEYYPYYDRVLPIIDGEQSAICQELDLLPGQRVIDAGTGSGILALFAAQQGAQVHAIDIMPRALQVAALNAKSNDLSVDLKSGRYQLDSYTRDFADIVLFNPPHNPTPDTLRLAAHADGGPDGIRIFTDFLSAAVKHVKNSGKIIFFQLSPSRNGVPKILEEIESITAGRCHIKLRYMLPTYSSEDFLREVYQSRFRQWADSLVREYPGIDLILGTITFDSKGLEIVGPVSKESRKWIERIGFHRSIVNTALNHQP